MSIKIHILSGSKKLVPFKTEIRLLTKSIENSVKKLISIGDIDVVFYYNPGMVSKKNGIGGSSPCANVIFVPLNPGNPGFLLGLKKDFPYVLAHEINHAIRFRTPIPKQTLFEAMISEGLADHFAIEVTKRKRPQLWSNALTNKQKKFFFEKASKEWDNETLHHYSWFYGSKTKKIPRWTAYTLGYDIVDSYLRKYPELSASKLISTSASTFRSVIE